MRPVVRNRPRLKLIRPALVEIRFRFQIVDSQLRLSEEAVEERNFVLLIRKPFLLVVNGAPQVFDFRFQVRFPVVYAACVKFVVQDGHGQRRCNGKDEDGNVVSG